MSTTKPSSESTGGQQSLAGTGQQSAKSAPAAKSVPAKQAQASGKDIPDSFDVTIDEFCARLSKTDKRVSMIGAFNFEEKSASRVKDSEANYRKRFDQFVVRPVKG